MFLVRAGFVQYKSRSTCALFISFLALQRVITTWLFLCISLSLSELLLFRQIRQSHPVLMCFLYCWIKGKWFTSTPRVHLTILPYLSHTHFFFNRSTEKIVPIITFHSKAHGSGLYVQSDVVWWQRQKIHRRISQNLRTSNLNYLHTHLIGKRENMFSCVLFGGPDPLSHVT